MLKKAEIVNGLKALGMKKDGIVLLHSAYLSFGEEVEGGPDGVLDAFLEVLGKKGTLLVPSFGKLGILVEKLGERKGAIFSSCPVARLTGLGPAAEELFEGHAEAPIAHGENTPYTRFAEKGGQICLLGVDQDRNTTLHSIEALLRLPYLQPVSAKVKVNGREVERTWQYFPGPHRDFIGLDHLLSDAGVMSRGVIGKAQIRLIDAAGMFETLLMTGKEEPDLMLCSNPACEDCVQQRAALSRAAFGKESFKLSASSRLAGRYVPEMIENLRKEGINYVELDYLQGKSVFAFPAEKIKAVVAELETEGIQISGVRLPCVPEEPEKLAAFLKTAAVSCVILPLPVPSGTVKQLEKSGVSVVLVNRIQSASSAAEEYQEAAGKKSSFVMNAVHFAEAGEHPFLRSWNSARLAKITGQLDVADVLWDGTPVPLANGNAEIKELISILRCRSFSGFLTLGGGTLYPQTLSDAAEDLRILLNNM